MKKLLLILLSVIALGTNAQLRVQGYGMTNDPAYDPIYKGEFSFYYNTDEKAEGLSPTFHLIAKLGEKCFHSFGDGNGRELSDLIPQRYTYASTGYYFNTIDNFTNINEVEFTFGGYTIDYGAIGLLTGLEYLTISYCDSVFVGGGEFSNLVNVKELRIDVAPNVRTVNGDFSNMISLEDIIFDGANNMVFGSSEWQYLTNLNSVNIQGCDKVAILDNSLTDLSNMTFLSLRANDNWRAVDDLDNMTSMETLILTDLNTGFIQNRMNMFPNLTTLDIRRSNGIKPTAGDISNSTNLQSLLLDNLPEFALNSSDISSLTNLTYLNVWSLPLANITAGTIATIGNNLTYFTMNYCPNADLNTADISSLVNATTVRLNYNGTMTVNANTISSLTSATRLDILGAASFTVGSETWSGTLTSINLSDNNMTQASVDNALGAVVNGGASNGSINLSGASNSAPSATGLAHKTTLEGRGWTVTVN